jgi:hypothetical protein
MARRQSDLDQARRSKLRAPLFWENDGDPMRLLTGLFSELGRIGLDRENLPSHQQETLIDIKNAIGYPRSEGFVTLFDTNRVDFSTLKESSNSCRRPKISLRCYLTTKHNLSVKWEPHHIDLNYPKIPAPEWIRPPLGYHGFDRPNDELLFLRNFGRLKEIRTSRDAILKAVDVYLLALGMVVWNDLKAFVSEHMDVQIQCAPKLKFGRPENYHLTNSFDKNEVPVGFEIEDKIEVERERLTTLVSQFEATNGIPLLRFWEVLQNHRYDHG